MALKSSREGLRKELVDYLGNIIIDENLKQNIINSINDVFINSEELTTSVNALDEKIRNETSAREGADTTLQENINAETSDRELAYTNLSDIKANKSDILTLEEIQASTDLTGKIASASALNGYIKLYSFKAITDNIGRAIVPNIPYENIISINSIGNILTNFRRTDAGFAIFTVYGANSYNDEIIKNTEIDVRAFYFG